MPEKSNYLRLIFMVYWDGSNPSAEVFYLPKHHHFKTTNLDGVASLEATALIYMQTHYTVNTPIWVVYLGHTDIELSGDEVVDVDWRLFTT